MAPRRLSNIEDADFPGLEGSSSSWSPGMVSTNLAISTPLRQAPLPPGVTATFMVGQVARWIGEPDSKPSRKSFRCSLFAAGGFLPQVLLKCLSHSLVHLKGGHGDLSDPDFHRTDRFQPALVIWCSAFTHAILDAAVRILTVSSR